MRGFLHKGAFTPDVSFVDLLEQAICLMIFKFSSTFLVLQITFTGKVINDYVGFVFQRVNNRQSNMNIQ